MTREIETILEDGWEKCARLQEQMSAEVVCESRVKQSYRENDLMQYSLHLHSHKKRRI
jgi:hypothetical protein